MTQLLGNMHLSNDCLLYNVMQCNAYINFSKFVFHYYLNITSINYFIMLYMWLILIVFGVFILLSILVIRSFNKKFFGIAHNTNRTDTLPVLPKVGSYWFKWIFFRFRSYCCVIIVRSKSNHRFKAVVRQPLKSLPLCICINQWGKFIIF